MIDKKASHGFASLEDIAAELEVSRERVRQIEKKALMKCRQWCEARGIDADILFDLASNRHDQSMR